MTQQAKKFPAKVGTASPSKKCFSNSTTRSFHHWYRCVSRGEVRSAVQDGEILQKAVENIALVDGPIQNLIDASRSFDRKRGVTL